MILENLWDNLAPRSATLSQLKKDYERGIAPELPYFIVGQDSAKEDIGKYLQAIDDGYFSRALLFADYGDGKTNLLKYLKLYFENKNIPNIHYIYQRADIDRYDIFLNLLKLVEDELLDILKDSILELDINNESDKEFIDSQVKSYRIIADFIKRITTASGNNSESIKDLIFMGTGRYYTKNYYSKYELPPLDTFSRREIFIFFMNILAHKGKYVIFALDELEKIYEKSKIRFRSFLTSYRELIDFSGQIKGHFLITALASSAANIDGVLSENPAFSGRIKKDMIPVKFLTKSEEKETLINNILSLLDIKNIPIKEIVAKLEMQYKKGAIKSNRQLFIDIFNELKKRDSKPVFVSLEDKLEELEINNEFDNLYRELENEGVLSKIEARFFDPLQYYLEYKGYEINTENLLKKTNIFYPNNSNKVYYFILNDNADVEIEISKIRSHSQDDKIITVFVPETIDLKYEDFENDNVNLIIYDPKKFLTLLIMFEEIDNQGKIEKIIQEYSRGEL